MEIIDLPKEYEQLYFVCLQDQTGELKEAGDHKKVWYHKMKDKGLRVKLALSDEGEVGGMIQYIPIEYSFVEGNDLYFTNCIWVIRRKKGIKNFQQRGFGRALLQAAENDVKAIGAKGIVARGVLLSSGMAASWFTNQGYSIVGKRGIRVLLWKSFTADAIPPKWIKQKKTPEMIPDKVVVTAFLNGWCPAQNLVFERAKRTASEFGDKVLFRWIDTFDRKNFSEWGIPDALFIDNKQVTSIPPSSYEKIRKMIARKVSQL